MSYEMQGAFALPGIDSLKQTAESEVWWGRWEQQVIVPVLLSGAARDAGNDPTDVLRPGLLLGQIASTKKWIEWTPTATDGSERLMGVMLYDQKMQAFGTNKDRWFGYAILGGNLKASKLLIPGGSSYGIDGDALELLIRSQLTGNGRFLLDDEPYGSNFGGIERQVTKTADYTVLESDNNTHFDTIGATGNVVFTLPAPRRGLRYLFTAGADYNMTVTGDAADKIITFNDVAATSVAFSTSGNKVGATVELIGRSTTKWLCLPHGANTMTVA